ncbi:hypothetical protein [Kitasatospora sp. NPDC059571]|uniref:hypothetical protein n=1 Tax=Kitasatospora sp. NPDC059571 TaxID=3346871 RepID=UPI0036B09E08
MSPIAALNARLARRLARRIARRAAARPCCYGRCTTADQRARAARAALCPCGCGRPAGQHWPPAVPITFPAQRTAEESR